MGDVTAADIVSTFGLAIALAACAGLRAWLPLLLAGGLSRAGLLDLGESFRFLSGNQALALFAVATVVEVLGDKVPVVDHTLDALSTVLRPAAGALLAASVFGRVTEPLQALALGVAIGAPSALVPHAGKAALRAASTALTAGVANPVLSLVEDGLTIVLFVLAVVVPIVVAAILLAVGMLLSRRLLTRGRAAAPAA